MPLKVADEQSRKILGIASVDFKQNEQRRATIDSPLQGKGEQKMLRPIIASTMLGMVVGSVLAAGVLFARAADPSVSIDNFTFAPRTLKIKAGTTVTWINRDDIPHGIASSNNAFAKSKTLDTDNSYSFTFTTPGIYQYFCYIHPHMVGSIVVEATTGSDATQ